MGGSEKAVAAAQVKAMRYGDVSVDLDGHVALVELHRPPHNFFDRELIGNLADALEGLDREPRCRALVLASEGKSFCAGADFSPSGSEGGELESVRAGRLYEQAIRLFSTRKPVVAAVQGAAVGGGLGLALTADFRVVTKEARFSANFAKLGLHPGFGLTHTLPRLIGTQRATLMFYTGRRISGEQAVEWGLADVLTSAELLRERARKLAGEIAEGAPLAVESVRATLRRGLADAVKASLEHELGEQTRLSRTEDHKEGIRAVNERRPGQFQGR
ncbi:MAG TPA: enoyl-CoA hydratase/isomerase family protein [Bryobacteraceae bacterium]|nr:enoyl-CoA hydratase/isomerase family protein [Bryobacteraceae bacterium]